MRSRQWWWQCLFFCLIMVATGPLLTARAGSLKIGKPAPDLVLHTPDGQALHSNEFRGRIVILTFWATWCEPCREELPLLSKFVTEHRAEGLEILAFSLDSPENRELFQSMSARLDFPVGMLGTMWASDYGRVWRIPVSFVIDRQGNLAYNGWDDDSPVWDQEKLQKVIAPLLMKR